MSINLNTQLQQQSVQWTIMQLFTSFMPQKKYIVFDSDKIFIDFLMMQTGCFYWLYTIDFERLRGKSIFLSIVHMICKCDIVFDIWKPEYWKARVLKTWLPFYFLIV